MNQQGPPQEAIQKLPVFQTAVQTYTEVFSSLPNLAKAAALPFAISLGIGLVTQGGQPSMEHVLLLSLLNLLPEAYFGVAWNRYVLLGAERATPRTLPSLAPRHWRFLQYAVLMLFLTALPLAGIASEFQPLLKADGEPSPELRAEVALNMMPFFALLIVAIALVLRFSFVFPAVSVDERYGLVDSWRHTRGQLLRLFFGLLLLMFPMAIVSFMVAAMFAGDPTNQPGLASLVASLAVNYVILALYFAFLSTAFRECTGWVPAEAAGPPSSDEMDEGQG